MSGPRGSEQRAGRPRDRAERWSWILDQLATRGRLGVPETAEVLQVSTATVRRDFHDLDRRGMVNRSHGGIVAAAVAYELPYRYRSTAEDDERARIARHTAELVRGDRAVAFNGGTTTTVP